MYNDSSYSKYAHFYPLADTTVIIIGASVGGAVLLVLLVLVILILVVCMVIRTKRRKTKDETYYSASVGYVSGRGEDGQYIYTEGKKDDKTQLVENNNVESKIEKTVDFHTNEEGPGVTVENEHAENHTGSEYAAISKSPTKPLSSQDDAGYQTIAEKGDTSNEYSTIKDANQTSPPSNDKGQAEYEYISNDAVLPPPPTSSSGYSRIHNTTEVPGPEQLDGEYSVVNSSLKEDQKDLYSQPNKTTPRDKVGGAAVITSEVLYTKPDKQRNGKGLCEGVDNTIYDTADDPPSLPPLTPDALYTAPDKTQKAQQPTEPTYNTADLAPQEPPVDTEILYTAPDMTAKTQKSQNPTTVTKEESIDQHENDPDYEGVTPQVPSFDPEILYTAPDMSAKTQKSQNPTTVTKEESIDQHENDPDYEGVTPQVPSFDPEILYTAPDMTAKTSKTLKQDAEDSLFGSTGAPTDPTYECTAPQVPPFDPEMLHKEETLHSKMDSLYETIDGSDSANKISVVPVSDAKTSGKPQEPRAFARKEHPYETIEDDVQPISNNDEIYTEPEVKGKETAPKSEPNFDFGYDAVDF